MSDQVRYVVFDANGEILRTGACDPEQLETQGQAIEGEGERHTHYVLDGVITAYTPEQVAVKAARPSMRSTWSNVTMSWTDMRSLDAIKAAQWAVIKAQRDVVEFGGYTWDGSSFDSDSQSQSRIMGAAQLATLAALAEQPFSIDWTLATNEVRSLDAIEMIEVGKALGVHVGAAHATARALRVQVFSATSAEELEGISWPD